MHRSLRSWAAGAAFLAGAGAFIGTATAQTNARLCQRAQIVCLQAQNCHLDYFGLRYCGDLDSRCDQMTKLCDAMAVPQTSTVRRRPPTPEARRPPTPNVTQIPERRQGDSD